MKHRTFTDVGTFDQETIDFPEMEFGENGLFWEKNKSKREQSGPLIYQENVPLNTYRNKPIDLRDFHYFPPVGDQEETKSCSAFALAALIEFYEYDLSGFTLPPAIGWMHKCIGKEELDEAVNFEYLAFKIREEIIPVVTNEYPWADTRCNRQGEIAMFKLVAKKRGEYSTSFVQKALHRRRPIITSLRVNEDFESWHSFKPYRYDPSIDYYEHAVLVIGYDKQNWICRNSFGDQWGSKGCFRIKIGDCKLCTGDTRIFTFAEPDPLNFV